MPWKLPVGYAQGMQPDAPTPQALASLLAHYADLAGRQMRQLLDSCGEPHDFYGMLRYHLGWADERLQPVAVGRGKGLRAALLLLVNDALGGAADDAAPLAAAVELLHNFSLIHDDIEDGSATRRHRATLWSLWGAPRGINAGDGLFAIAHLALYQSPLSRSAPARLMEILHHFEQTALRLCEGQHLDMTFEHLNDVSVQSYLRMIGGKTAALIGAAAWIGAYAAGATPAQAAAAGGFGRELGLAFQMQDDILGLWGQEAITGKSAVSDVASRKKTLPVLLALEHAAPDQRERLRDLYAQPNDDAATIAEIMAILDRAQARERARDYLQRHWQAAMAALAEIGLSAAAHERLSCFAHQFVDRSA